MIMRAFPAPAVYCIVHGSKVPYPPLDRAQRPRKGDAMATVDKLGGNWVIARGGVDASDDADDSLAPLNHRA